MFRLPDICYSTLPTTEEVIIIRKGVSGYYPCDLTTDNPNDNKVTADYQNSKLGVTDAQVKAMEIGSMFGWDVPGADPLHYKNQGGQLI